MDKLMTERKADRQIEILGLKTDLTDGQIDRYPKDRTFQYTTRIIRIKKLPNFLGLSKERKRFQNSN